jgi:ubiquitin carboxyl-terminal hydrolase 7
MLRLFWLQGTRVERVINELFEGHTLNFIECVNVDYKSSRRESFMDLQLDVKGCPNIYDSFDRCAAVGAELYDAFVY